MQQLTVKLMAERCSRLRRAEPNLLSRSQAWVGQPRFSRGQRRALSGTENAHHAAIMRRRGSNSSPRRYACSTLLLVARAIHLGDLAREVGALGGEIAKRRAEAAGGQIIAF